MPEREVDRMTWPEPDPCIPPAAQRQAWDVLLEDPLNRHRRDQAVARAQQVAAEPVPIVPATAYMAFMRTGDRRAYQDLDFGRLRRLGWLVIAECLEHQGRFLDPLIDYLWAVCEQSTWCLPAHDGLRLLTDVERPVPDLQATHIALVLGETAHLLGPELDAVTPEVRRRLRHEVNRRVLEPFLSRDDLWWLGLDPHREVNNWTAVCNAGVVGAALYLEPDPPRLARIISRSRQSLERFLDCYGPAGECDEGPAYWNYGVGHLVLLAELLLASPTGRVNLYEDKRVRAMAEFPHRVHLTGDYYLNFADCRPRVAFSRALTRRLAERVHSDGLLALASQQRPWTDEPPDLLEAVRQLFWDRPALAPQPIPKEPATWLADVRWLIARQRGDDPATLILAVKSGHNAEKHNHNDGGAFVVYLGGEPMIIDLGAEEYTRQTFGPQRYQRLAMRSLGHDVPLVRGVEQGFGRQFTSRRGDLEIDDAHVRLVQDLRGFYPPEAGIRSWTRLLELDRTAPAGCIRLVDRFALETAGEIALPLYTPQVCRLEGPGRLVLAGSTAGLAIEFDVDSLVLELERLALDDAGLRASWGETLTRVWLRTPGPVSEGALTVTFTPRPSFGAGG